MLSEYILLLTVGNRLYLFMKAGQVKCEGRKQCSRPQVTTLRFPPVVSMLSEDHFRALFSNLEPFWNLVTHFRVLHIYYCAVVFFFKKKYH